MCRQFNKVFAILLKFFFSALKETIEKIENRVK